MKIAVLGATGAVGREMVQDLEDLVPGNYALELFASPRSAGEHISFRGQRITVQAFQREKMRGVDFALMSAGGTFSKEHAQAIADAGAIVIDNSSAWRMDPQCPLIVPEVNGTELFRTKPRIIANPNCSTIQMVVALKPLADAFGLELVEVASYQSVSGTGQKGIKELAQQVEASLKFQELTPTVYDQTIAFNVLPAIGGFTPDGSCEEEVKIVRETQRIMGLPDLMIMATTARVPTFHCHSEAVTVKLKQTVTRDEAQNALKKGAGLVVCEVDDHREFLTNLQTTSQRGVHISRIRLPYGQKQSSWVQMWVVADNLKKGAATNAVQILNYLRDHQ